MKHTPVDHCIISHMKAPHQYRPLLWSWYSEHKTFTSQREESQQSQTHSSALPLTSFSFKNTWLVSYLHIRAEKALDWCRKAFKKKNVVHCIDTLTRQSLNTCIVNTISAVDLQSNESLESAEVMHWSVITTQCCKIPLSTVQGHSVHLQPLCRS